VRGEDGVLIVALLDLEPEVDFVPRLLGDGKRGELRAQRPQGSETGLDRRGGTRVIARGERALGAAGRIGDRGEPAGQRFGRVRRGELRQRDEIVRLTDREREMLRLLAENASETVARETLAGSGVAANERTVDVQVNRLRRKIERDPANPLYLQTARGAGYRLLVDR